MTMKDRTRSIKKIIGYAETIISLGISMERIPTNPSAKEVNRFDGIHMLALAIRDECGPHLLYPLTKQEDNDI